MLKKILALTLIVLASSAMAHAETVAVADSSSVQSEKSSSSVKSVTPSDDEKGAMGDDDDDDTGTPLGDKDGQGDDAED